VLSTADGADSASVLSALEALRGLSEERLDEMCAYEAAAYEAVENHLRGMDVCYGPAVVSGCMALFTLGCRNGIALCGGSNVYDTAYGILKRWLEYAASGGDDYDAGAAIVGVCMFFGEEAGPKMAPEIRGPVEADFGDAWVKLVFPTVGKAFSEQRVREVFASSMKAGILDHHDISLACCWGGIVLALAYIHPGALPAANELGLFRDTLALQRRVEPAPLPAEWWSSTCDVVDVTSARLACIYAGVYSQVKRLPPVGEAPWWGEYLEHALRLVRMNA